MTIYSAFVGKETFCTLKTNQEKHSPKIMFFGQLSFLTKRAGTLLCFGIAEPCCVVSKKKRMVLNANKFKNTNRAKFVANSYSAFHCVLH